ncbi:hypothetical protein H7J87_00360 [Mycolicibacterium wolinskyi]|uniref:PASTA domain-containing protein n=1 Tax=Mycolicibacterium wolinskyi TaxID=59750 RepID=A0A1X2FBU8_9MYCO|nr:MULTISPECIES: hypothetical protein [Mycolicibacterium]MCV7283783.1 hypothetical protein [Mycolicibacterium wolinskyi]MCV7297217.1 hypothetical protein [Mycolicibacterium goodii]ORX15902.1 hypothetical protein AWC31_00480 [Mycolicibacterium wolinskyi]
MNKALMAAMTGSCTVLLLASPANQAAAAPAGPGSVQDTVSMLESRGYKVIMNKTGSAPLERCTVGAVRPGRDVTELRKNVRERTVERVVYKTVYVDVSC